LIHRRGCRVA